MSTYSVKRDGKVVGSGTYQTLELLQMDYPSPEYELVLDEVLPLHAPEPSYTDLRRVAYPPLSDLADALYWQAQGDNTHMDAYLAKVDAVKSQIPKP